MKYVQNTFLEGSLCAQSFLLCSGVLQLVSWPVCTA